MSKLLSSQGSFQGEEALDALYTTALQEAGDWHFDTDFVQDFCATMGTVLVLQNPLTLTALKRLLGFEGDEIACLSGVASVLALQPTVHLLHPSFADFRLAFARSGQDKWHCNEETCHQETAFKCLHLLSAGSLGQNMCNLTLSEDFTTRTLQEEVAYACVFWVHHVCKVSNQALSLGDSVEQFLRSGMLHWFEAMSILGSSRKTISLLYRLLEWATVSAAIFYEELK